MKAIDKKALSKVIDVEKNMTSDHTPTPLTELLLCCFTQTRGRKS